MAVPYLCQQGGRGPAPQFPRADGCPLVPCPAAAFETWLGLEADHPARKPGRAYRPQRKVDSIGKRGAFTPGPRRS